MLLTHSRYKIGDAFFQLPLADAQSLLASSTEQIDLEVSRLEETLGDVREELQQLKVTLYARLDAVSIWRRRFLFFYLFLFLQEDISAFWSAAMMNRPVNRYDPVDGIIL